MPRGPADGVGTKVMIWSVEFPEPKRWCIWEKSLLARQALEGSAVPGSQETLLAFSDPSKRPALLRDPLLEEVANHVPRIPFDLDKDTFGKNLRSTRRESGRSVRHDNGAVPPTFGESFNLHNFSF